MSRIDLSIIILSYKSKEHLKVLLPSIWASEGVEFGGDVVAPSRVVARDKFMSNQKADKSARYSAEIIIIDNDSRDGTIEWLKANSYKLKAISNINTGFAAGNNLGIKKAQGKYILLLNPDTKLQPDTLSEMLKFMESRPDIGIAGCKIIKPDGSLDLACRRRFPNPWNSFLRLFLNDNTNYNYSDINENLEMEVDSIVGAFMLVRKSVVEKIGLLDESFFMYGEDLDWCWRCKETGLKVWYYPKTFITHYKGSSSKKIAFKALKWFHDAMWIFYNKHYARQYPFALNWLIWLGIYSRMTILVILNFFRSNPRVSK